MIIGNFRQNGDGYIGLIATLGLREQARIEPAKPGAEGAPAYVVLSDDGFIELGAAWRRHNAKTGKAYLSVRLDAPTLAVPINGALIVQPDGEFILVWSRRKSAIGDQATA